MFPIVKVVKPISIPAKYKPGWFMDMYLESPPIGEDPITKKSIYYGDGVHIACLLEDKPKEVFFKDDYDIPF